MMAQPPRTRTRLTVLTAAVTLLLALLVPWVAAQDEPGRALASGALNGGGASVVPVALDPGVCDVGRVDIAIRDVANLYGYQFVVHYDPTLVSATAVFDNTWFDPSGNGFDGPAAWAAACDDTLGECRFARTRGNPDGPLSGGGAVARITLLSKLPPTITPTTIRVSDIILSDRDGYQILPVSGGEVTVDVCGHSVATYCPTPDAAVGPRRTDLLGIGQGSTSRTFRTRKLTIPNPQAVDSLYGQLAAVEVGVMKRVAFRYPNGTNVWVATPTSPGYRNSAVRWWGSPLTPSKFITSRFEWGIRGNKSPRAFVLWPTYRTSGAYANVLTTFADSATNHVYHSAASGWHPQVSQTIAIPPTQSAGADIVVKVAVVDNDKDSRPVILSAEAGGVTAQIVSYVPNRRDTLNLETLRLDNVPQGTDRVTLTLRSPAPGNAYPFGGDSAAMIGAAVSYACDPAALP
jgi:hypothetical protein